MKSSFMFIRMLLEMLGFGKYVPKQGLYTAAEFVAEVEEALRFDPNEDLKGLLRVHSWSAGPRHDKIIIGAVGSGDAEEAVDGTAVLNIWGALVVDGNGFYSKSPEKGIIGFAAELMAWQDNRVTKERLDELRRINAKALMLFVSMYPFSWSVTDRVRKILAGLLDE